MRRDTGHDEAWMDRANCVGLDADMFFPGRYDVTATREARAVCAACVVRDQCLEYALNPERPMVYGIWGGKSERERRAIRAARRRREAA